MPTTVVPTARLEPAPAKVNLTLRVLGRRPDGYHEIESLVVFAAIAFLAFALGRWLRPVPPPLIIQRAANSPLSDLPVNPVGAARRGDEKGSVASKQSANSGSVDDVVYLCGARTQKGTPCRRRVHFAGERCYQHKGMPAIVPLEKLTVKNK